MKFLSWNVNGIRAAERKGFLKWFRAQKADFVSLQEVKARPEQLSDKLLKPRGYTTFWMPAERAGYSGVAIYAKHEPLNVIHGLGEPEFDGEGRVLTLELQNLFLVNAYFPHTRHDLSRLDFKLRFCGRIHQFVNGLKAKGKHVVLCGDYNVAHREIDLRNPKQNMKNPGFLPEERQWMDRLLDDYVDIFRHRVKEPGHYTWWSFRKGVREKNVGWRIDYHCIDPDLVDRVQDCGHQSAVLGSDHCPVLLELKP